VKFYLVGGAVRDKLMGVENNDRDYVVVGATPAELEALGYKNVGESFTVFMDPVNGDQYALARKERKTGVGYTGFSVEFDPSITLEEDLYRRDLTINAMAEDLETGEIIDPYGGLTDLKSLTLRHVSDAFKEDPLRVIRLARFFARFEKFSIATETIQLAVSLVDSGEMDKLADERLWAEMEKVMEQSNDPCRFYSALWDFGVLIKVKFFRDVFGEVSAAKVTSDFQRLMGVLNKMMVKGMSAPEALMYFVAVASHPSRTQKSHAIPSRVKNLTDHLWAVREMSMNVTPQEVLAFFNGIRAWDAQSMNVPDLLKAMSIAELAGESFPIPMMLLGQAVKAGRKVSAAPYMHLSGAEIGKAMARERLARMSEAMKC
jgi:hypothetical protein